MAERTVLVRLKANPNDLVRGVATATGALKGLTSQVDTTNDRMAWMAQSFLAIGPALAPIGAAAVPAMAGLSTQLALTASAAGVTALALVGVGDGLKALNDYQLEPTAQHLAKLNEEMVKLGPAGADFVRFLDSLSGDLRSLQLASREALLPGVTQGLDSLMTRLPEVRSIVTDIAGALGTLAAEGGRAIASDRFTEFFTYLDNTARPLLIEMGHTLGNFVEGLSNLFVAVGPLSERFSAGFLQMSEDFAAWSRGLDTDSTFQDFLAYVSESIPKVNAFLSSLVDALVNLAQAVAPIGDVMLPVLTDLLGVFSSLVSTPLGTAFFAFAAAVSAYGRAAALASVTTGGLISGLTPGARAIAANTKATLIAIPAMNQFGTALLRAGQSAKYQSETTLAANRAVASFLRGVGPAVAAAGLLAVNLSHVDNKLGLTTTSLFAMSGLMIGGPWGAAVGAGIGLTKDFADANDHLADTVTASRRALEGTSYGDVTAQLAQVNEEISRLMHAGETLDPAGFMGNFELISAKLGGQLDSLLQMRRALAEYQAQLRRGRQTKRDLLDLLGGSELGRAAGYTRHELLGAAQSAEDFRKAVLLLNDVLSGRAELRDYQASLDDFTKSLKDNGKTLDINREKGRSNQAALDAIAATALKVAENLEGLKRVKFLEGARAEFVSAAVEAGKSDAAAKRLADRLFDIGQIEAKPKVKVEGKRKAEADIAGVNAKFSALDALMGGPTITANTRPAIRALDELAAQLNSVTSVFGAVPIPTGTAQHRADGGTVPGLRYPYRDKVLTYLAPGEEVITNRRGEADRFRADRAAGLIPKYADGGTVGAPAGWSPDARPRPALNASGGTDGVSRVELTDDQLSRLALAVANARPLYGDVHLKGDGSFQREIERGRTVGGGGVIF